MARVDAREVARERKPRTGTDAVCPITTGLLARHRQPRALADADRPLEGITIKIKVIERMASGYRDRDYCAGPPRPEVRGAARLCVDNGNQFCGQTNVELGYQRGVQLRLIQPGTPNQNPCVESFHGRLRDESLTWC